MTPTFHRQLILAALVAVFVTFFLPTTSRAGAAGAAGRATMKSAARLTRTQWRALAYIFRTPGLTQTELAKCLELERASVGHIIDQLQKADYVERRAVEGNRRVWTLHIRPKAVSILPSLRAEADVVYAKLLAGINSGDIATYKRVLAMMSANL